MNDLSVCKNNENKSDICFDGNSIIGIKTHELINKGLLYVPQKNDLFEDMTLQEKLVINLLHKSKKSIKGARYLSHFKSFCFLLLIVFFKS